MRDRKKTDLEQRIIIDLCIKSCLPETYRLFCKNSGLKIDDKILTELIVRQQMHCLIDSKDYAALVKSFFYHPSLRNHARLSSEDPDQHKQNLNQIYYSQHSSNPCAHNPTKKQDSNKKPDSKAEKSGNKSKSQLHFDKTKFTTEYVSIQNTLSTELNNSQVSYVEILKAHFAQTANNDKVHIHQPSSDKDMRYENRLSNKKSPSDNIEFEESSIFSPSSHTSNQCSTPHEFKPVLSPQNDFYLQILANRHDAIDFFGTQMSHGEKLSDDSIHTVKTSGPLAKLHMYLNTLLFLTYISQDDEEKALRIADITVSKSAPNTDDSDRLVDSCKNAQMEIFAMLGYKNRNEIVQQAIDSVNIKEIHALLNDAAYQSLYDRENTLYQDVKQQIAQCSKHIKMFYKKST